MSTEDKDLAKMQEVLDMAPFHRWLGLQAQKLRSDGLTISMPWREEVVSNPATQSAHGGVLASLIDLAGFYALIAVGKAPLATADLRVDYHRAACPGMMTVEGRVVRIGRTLSVAEAYVLDESGGLLSSGRGAYYVSSGGSR